MVRKLKYHEATLLRKLDFINWKSDASQRENAIIRRYHIQDREDYHTYNKVCGLITKLTTQLKIDSDKNMMHLTTVTTSPPRPRLADRPRVHGCAPESSDG